MGNAVYNCVNQKQNPQEASSKFGIFATGTQTKYYCKSKPINVTLHDHKGPNTERSILPEKNMILFLEHEKFMFISKRDHKRNHNPTNGRPHDSKFIDTSIR